MNVNILRVMMSALLALSVVACGGGGGGGGGGGLPAAGVASGPGAGAFASADGTAVAPGDGPGTGSGASSAGGSTAGGTAAAGGDDGSGVGSGGTGVSATAGVGIGSADGLGSVIVNGIRYNTDTATFSIEDAPELQLGMSVKVSGAVNSDQKTGTATRVESAAELRGAVSSVDLASGTFSLLGTTVSTDPETVWADTSGLAGVVPGTTVQLWGLPGAPGTLRATRVAQVAAGAAPILTGTIENLDAAARVFSIGQLQVSYAAATFTGGLEATTLANGTIVRVRANSSSSVSALAVTTVQGWYPLPRVSGLRVDLDGLITNYAGLAAFRVLGTTVDATGVQITGGQATNIGNGVKVEVAGLLTNGVVRATKLKIRHIPGTGGPSSFTLIGPVGAFGSLASFRVRGQLVDASRAGVAFVNGSSSNLGNGTKVTVTGSRVLNGVLLADVVTFD